MSALTPTFGECKLVHFIRDLLRSFDWFLSWIQKASSISYSPFIIKPNEAWLDKHHSLNYNRWQPFIQTKGSAMGPLPSNEVLSSWVSPTPWPSQWNSDFRGFMSSPKKVPEEEGSSQHCQTLLSLLDFPQYKHLILATKSLRVSLPLSLRHTNSPKALCLLWVNYFYHSKESSASRASPSQPLALRCWEGRLRAQMNSH